MNYYKNSQLTHSGILGQKWGIRRYQNKDGSLTSEGRQHYGVGDPRGSSNSTPKTKTATKSVQTQTQQPEQPKPKSVYEMSNAELKEAKDRMFAENEYYKELDKKLEREMKAERARIEAAKPFIQKFAEYSWDKVVGPAITEAAKNTISNYLKVEGNKLVKAATKVDPPKPDKNKQNQNQNQNKK